MQKYKKKRIFKKIEEEKRKKKKRARFLNFGSYCINTLADLYYSENGIFCRFTAEENRLGQ